MEQEAGWIDTDQGRMLYFKTPPPPKQIPTWLKVTLGTLVGISILVVATVGWAIWVTIMVLGLIGFLVF